MAKTTNTPKVKVLCGKDVSFMIGDTSILVSDLTVEQAQVVAAQYPGMYVEIINQSVNGTDNEPQQS